MNSDSTQGQPHSLRQAIRREGPWLLLLALLALIFFGPVVLGRAWIPRGGGDLVSFIYPMYRFIAASLHDGVIPLWNPHLYAGAPLIADNQSGIFYPFNLFLFLLNPNFSYGVIEALVIFHFWWAGAGMFLCLQRILPKLEGGFSSARQWAAMVGAIAIMFSDVLIIHTGNLNLVAVSAWLPWIFLAFHLAVTRASLSWAVGSGVLMGLATLAGHGQMTFILAAYIGAYAVFQSIARRDLRPVAYLLLLAVVALGLSAISVLPAAAGNVFTLRGEFSYEASTLYSLTPQSLIGLLAPGYFGRSSADFWGNWPRVEVGYMGVLPLLLVFHALRIKWTRQRLFFILSALFFTLLALGPSTPLHPLIFKTIPLPFRVPARFMLLSNFSLAVLAAESVLWLASSRFNQPQPGARRWHLLALLPLGVVAAVAALWMGNYAPEHLEQMQGALLAMVIFAGLGWLLQAAHLWNRLPGGWLAILAPLLLFVDVYSLGHNVEVDPNPATVGYDHPAVVSYLQSDPGIHRMDEATGLWQPSAAQLFGLYSAGGVFNPLQLANYGVYVSSVGFRGSPLYNLLGVKYIVAGKDTPPGDTGYILPVFNEDPQLDVYLNTRALPRLMLLYESQLAADHDAVFDAIHDPDFDPARTVILEMAQVPGLQTLSLPPGAHRLEILHYGLNQVAFLAETDSPAYFLLTDIYHPGWKAEVNEQPVALLTADYAFRAVKIEPGRNEIVMRFHPPGWRPGWIITTLTILALAVWGTFRRWAPSRLRQSAAATN